MDKDNGTDMDRMTGGTNNGTKDGMTVTGDTTTMIGQWYKTDVEGKRDVGAAAAGLRQAVPVPTRPRIGVGAWFPRDCKF